MGPFSRSNPKMSQIHQVSETGEPWRPCVLGRLIELEKGLEALWSTKDQELHAFLCIHY